MNTSPSRRRYRAHLLALEPRMMFDAAAAAVAQGMIVDHGTGEHPVAFDDAIGTDTPHDAEQATPAVIADHGSDAIQTDRREQAADEALPPVTIDRNEFDHGGRSLDPHDVRSGNESGRAMDTADMPAPSAAREIVFIDTSVDDYRQLADEWASRGEVVLIDGTKDGIDQVRAALAGQAGITAIHFVSHGEEGAFWLGTTKLDEGSISGSLAGSLGAIGRSLAAGGDILIYGCSFAEGADGARALAAFAGATHADVAASTDATGFAARGGDWVLEATRGSIEARSLSSGDWVHTLDPNQPVPISVTVNSLTVKDSSGAVVFSSANNYNNNAVRSPDVTQGAVATWANAATYQGHGVDLRATIVSLTSGDAVQFNRVTGTGTGPDDPTFLLRDLTSGNTPATVQLRWELVDHITGEALPADVRFTIADIDGINGNPNTRETVTASTQNLAYYTRDKNSDIHFNSTLNSIEASGTQDENNPVGATLTPKSAASFDWTKVSSFTLTYTLTPNQTTNQAQFYHDGDADFVYDNPVYVSVPRLDLDGNDSTASGNDAHFTFTENGPGVPVVDSDVVVSNPMDINSITGATVKLTNYKTGDGFTVGTLPANVSYSIGAVSNGTLTLTFTGLGSESDYKQALLAVRYTNSSDTPDTTQRQIDVAFSNDTLTSATATSRIDVIPVNDPPVAVDDAVTTAEDTAVTIDVLRNDTDPENDTLAVTAASALHGTVLRNADGTLTYTPNADYNGSDSISYTISDGNGGTSTATVAVTITPVNDAPTRVGTLPARSGVDGGATSFNTAGAFTDVDGDTLTYSATNLPAGLTINAATGVISGTIDRSASQVRGGNYTVIVTARDPSGASTTQNFAYTVTNPAPTANNDSATTNEDTAVTIAVLANDTDPDGDPLSVTMATALHGTVVRNADGTLTYTPNADYNGNDTIAYSISDGQGGTADASVAVTIVPVNDAPRPSGTLPDRTGTDAGSVAFGTARGFTDVDGDTLSYAATGLPAGLVIDAATGIVSGTLDRSASQVNGGRYSVTVTARDPSGASTTQTFLFTAVNPAPVAADDSATTAEDTPVTIVVMNNDSDPDGDPLTVTAATATHGSVAINPDNTLTYTPDADYNGSDTIAYTITDGEGGTAMAHVAVTITPVNDAPRANSIPPAYTVQDGASVSLSVAPAFSDPDGDRLTYTATGLPAGLTLDRATGIVSGTVDRSASQQNGGVYTIVLTATDPSNATAMQTVTLTVTNPAPVARPDSATSAEDTPVVIAVLGNDGDPDGDSLTVIAASAQHGSVVLNPDGTLTYTPDRDFNGTDTISYTISDGEGGTATSTATVTVTPVNDAPVATGGLPDRGTLDGAAVSYPTAAAFRDVDGDALTYSADGLPAGLAIDSRTGVISGTLDRSASQLGGGHYAVTVTARDGGATPATQTFAIDVANPGPSAVDDMASTNSSAAVVIAVLANDGDPDGDPLSVTGAIAGRGTVVVLADNTLRYTPPAGFIGRDTITYTVSDGQGGTATARVLVDVSDTPPMHAPLPGVAARDGEPISLPIGEKFSDPDGDPLTFTAAGLPPGLSIDPATGTITGTIDHSASQIGGGAYRTTITASDGRGGATSATLDWTITNPGPTAADDTATTAEDTPVVIAPLANDRDADGDPLTIVSATAGHGSVTINPDGTLTYTPDPDFNGHDTILYTISDGEGGRATANIAVTVTPVNDAPTTSGLPPRITADGASVAKPVAPAFADRDGDTLTYTATGLPAGLSIDPRTGIISGTIVPGSANGGPARDGVFHVVVTATDPSGLAVDAPFDWTISQTAPTPVDDRATTPEDTAVTIPALANDSDPDGDPLTIIAATAVHGTVTISGGNLIFTPDAGFTGDATIVYTVADPSGHRATATVLVTVTPSNDAPIARPLPGASGRDAEAVNLPVGGFFADPDGDPLRFTATGLPAGLSIDPATGLISGRIDRNSSQVPGGVYHVIVTATDPSGAGATSAFDWTIVNPAPTATDDSASVREDMSTTIPVLVNDSDPDGDPLSVVAVSAGHGVVTINPDGTLSYTPDPNFNGTDVIVYTIDDGNGGRASASVLVTVTPVNDAPRPVGIPAAQYGTDGATVGIETGNWFADPDGDRLTYTATGLPAGLAIDPATGRIAGTLDRSASQVAGGAYTVTVTAIDPAGASGTRTFTITVVNPAPVAADDAARTDQRVGITIPVLANDRDPDGDPLTVIGAMAANGSVTINPDGTLVYVPGANFAGTDTIRYTISDGQDGTASAIVTVVVDPVDRAPVIAGRDPIDAVGGRPTVIDALTGVTDPDGDPLTLTDATSVNGMVVVNRDGTLTFTPALGFVGTTTITFTVTDGKGGLTTGTIVVRVADGRGADIEQLLRIGRVSFRDPAPSLATITLADGLVRNPLSLIDTVEHVRDLRATGIGDKPVLDAVEAARSLNTTAIDPDRPITAEVARLDAIRDLRDGGDRLFDQRWGDFLVKGFSGFSAAADRHACIMVESVVRGGAIYLEVRDTAAEGSRAPIRSVDVRPARGGRVDWIRVDHRGLAIIERAANMDELHLIVRVTRTDGRTSATPIVVQGATGEIELDRHHDRSHRSDHRSAAQPLDATLSTPTAAVNADAARLASHFE